jgi:hypothetical protein
MKRCRGRGGQGAGVYLSQTTIKPIRVDGRAGEAESLFWALWWCICPRDVEQVRWARTAGTMRRDDALSTIEQLGDSAHAQHIYSSNGLEHQRISD